MFQHQILKPPMSWMLLKSIKNPLWALYFLPDPMELKLMNPSTLFASGYNSATIQSTPYGSPTCSTSTLAGCWMIARTCIDYNGRRRVSSQTLTEIDRHWNPIPSKMGFNYATCCQLNIVKWCSQPFVDRFRFFRQAQWRSVHTDVCSPPANLVKFQVVPASKDAYLYNVKVGLIITPLLDNPGLAPKICQKEFQLGAPGPP